MVGWYRAGLDFHIETNMKSGRCPLPLHIERLDTRAQADFRAFEVVIALPGEFGGGPVAA